jgi:predicted nuclease with TOPRIM domain
MRPDDLYTKHTQIKEKSLTEFTALRNEYTELESKFKSANDTIELIFKEINQENSHMRSIALESIKKNSLEKYRNHMSSCVSIYFFIFNVVYI